MAYSQRLENVTLEASADFSSHKYKVVEFDANGKAQLAPANQGLGVLQNAPQSGEECTVAIRGATRVIAGGALTRGRLVRVGSGGWVLSVNSGAAHPGDFIVMGRSQMTVASGDIATIELERQALVNVASGDAMPL